MEDTSEIEIPEPPEISDLSEAPDTETTDAASSVTEIDQLGDAATPPVESTDQTEESLTAVDQAGDMEIPLAEDEQPATVTKGEQDDPSKVDSMELTTGCDYQPRALTIGPEAIDEAGDEPTPSYEDPDQSRYASQVETWGQKEDSSVVKVSRAEDGDTLGGDLPARFQDDSAHPTATVTKGEEGHKVEVDLYGDTSREDVRAGKGEEIRKDPLDEKPDDRRPDEVLAQSHGDVKDALRPHVEQALSRDDRQEVQQTKTGQEHAEPRFEEAKPSAELAADALTSLLVTVAAIQVRAVHLIREQMNDR